MRKRKSPPHPHHPHHSHHPHPHHHDPYPPPHHPHHPHHPPYTPHPPPPHPASYPHMPHAYHPAHGPPPPPYHYPHYPPPPPHHYAHPPPPPMPHQPYDHPPMPAPPSPYAPLPTQSSYAKLPAGTHSPPPAALLPYLPSPHPEPLQRYPDQPPYDYDRQRFPTIQQEAAIYLHQALHSGRFNSSLAKCAANSKAVYALYCQTYKNRENLSKVIAYANLPNVHNIHPAYLLVLVYDVVLGQGLKGKNETEKLILQHQLILKNTLKHVEDLKRKEAHDNSGSNDSTSASSDDMVRFVRFIRVNTLAKSTEDCIKQLIEEGYEKVEKITSGDSGRKVFCTDAIDPDLLTFPEKLNLESHPLWHAGVFVKMDKAAGFPVLSMNLQKGWEVIDACAAPGNKTIHIASILGNDGKIFAFEMNRDRAEKLQRNVEKAGATCVTVQHSDFLRVNPQDKKYAQVNAILLDPSCSGSGTVYYHDTVKPLAQHAASQVKLLRHALSFPSPQVVVYSTCSINVEENEEVVKEVLKSKGTEWRLSKALPKWPVRGLPVMEGSEKLLRTKHEGLLLGFFVAKFKRICTGAEQGVAISDSEDEPAESVQECEQAKDGSESRQKRQRRDSEQESDSQDTTDTTLKDNEQIKEPRSLEVLSETAPTPATLEAPETPATPTKPATPSTPTTPLDTAANMESIKSKAEKSPQRKQALKPQEDNAES